MSTLRHLLRLGWAHKVRYLLNALGWATIWAMPLLPALIVQRFFDRLESGVGYNVPTLIAFILAYGAGRIGVMVLSMLNDGHLMFRTGGMLRTNMLDRVLQMPGADALDETPGNAISTFREDVEIVEETVSWTVDMVGVVAQTAFALVILLSVNARITLFVFAPLVFVVFLSERAGTRLRRFREAARRATADVTEAIGEMFGAVQAIKVADAEGSMLAHLETLNERRLEAEVRDRVLTSLLESVFWNAVNIGTGVILIIAAQELAGGGSFSVGDFALFVSFLTLSAEMVHFVGIFIARVRQAEVSSGRISRLLRGEPFDRLIERGGFDLSRTPASPPPGPDNAADRLEVLSVRSLTYHYGDNGVGITDVSLDIAAGSFVVITGKVGAGKTTLVRCLLGLLPAEGKISWNGEPIDRPADFFVPPRTAYTPQVPKLFSMSLRDNLLLGLDASDDALDTAVAGAVLEHDVARMPEGLETQVGPLGVRLSGGQIQRTAVARMLVRRPELYVFDDVSSALDVETEAMLWERLLADDTSTSLVISHRLPALQRADLIVVLDGGSVVATGTFDELSGVAAGLPTARGSLGGEPSRSGASTGETP